MARGEKGRATCGCAGCSWRRNRGGFCASEGLGEEVSGEGEFIDAGRNRRV